MSGYGLGGALVAGLVVIGLSVIRALASVKPWREENCARPRCGHDAYDHQDEVTDGACARLGCQCRSFQRP